MAFQGTWDACLQHYLNTLPRGTREASKSRSLLANFTGASLDTIRKWSADSLPLGLFQLRVKYFLTALGYEVANINSWNSYEDEFTRKRYFLGKMIAYGMLSAQSASLALGFANVDSVYRLLRGGTGRSDRVADAISALWTARREDTNSLEGNWREKLAPERARLWGNTSEGGQQNAIAVQASVAQVRPQTGGHATIKTLAHLVTAMLPLAQEVASDRYSQDDRKLLRKLAGNDGVFQLSTALNQLCGEKARDIVAAGQIKKEQR